MVQNTSSWKDRKRIVYAVICVVLIVALACIGRSLTVRSHYSGDEQLAIRCVQKFERSLQSSESFTLNGDVLIFTIDTSSYKKQPTTNFVVFDYSTNRNNRLIQETAVCNGDTYIGDYSQSEDDISGHENQMDFLTAKIAYNVYLTSGENAGEKYFTDVTSVRGKLVAKEAGCQYHK